MNKVILVGNLTRDTEMKYTDSGVAIGKTGIATNRKFKTASGELKDETMFVDLTFWGKTAEAVNRYLKKGSKVLVEGRLVLEQWVAEDGTKRSKHSVTVESMEMLGGKNTETSAPETSASAPSAPTADVPEVDIDEDEIPF